MKKLTFLLITVMLWVSPSLAQEPVSIDTTIVKDAFEIPDTIRVTLGDETFVFIGTDAKLLQKNVQAAIDAYNAKPAKTVGEILLYILGLLTSGILLSSVTQVVRIWKQLQTVLGGISRPKKITMFISLVAAIAWMGFVIGFKVFDLMELVKLWGVAYLVTEVVYEFATRYIFKKQVDVKAQPKN